MNNTQSPTPQQEVWFLKHNAWNLFDEGLSREEVVKELEEDGVASPIVEMFVSTVDEDQPKCIHSNEDREEILQKIRLAVESNDFDRIANVMDPACDDDRTLFKMFDALGHWLFEPHPIYLGAAFGLSKMIGYGDCPLIHALRQDGGENHHAAAFALGTMGADAEVALETLETAANNSPNELVRSACRKSIDRIRSAINERE